jgi:hypothetical protein
MPMLKMRRPAITTRDVSTDLSMAFNAPFRSAVVESVEGIVNRYVDPCSLHFHLC